MLLTTENEPMERLNLIMSTGSSITRVIVAGIVAVRKRISGHGRSRSEWAIRPRFGCAHAPLSFLDRSQQATEPRGLRRSHSLFPDPL